MNIYSCVDNTNIDKIIALFNSVYINANLEKKENLRFFLLVDNIPENIPFIPEYLENKLDIRKLKLDSIWLNILNNFNNTFYQKASWCKHDMNFARFLIFDHFPKVERLVYLDWDMIVQEDIFKLETEYNNTTKMVVANCGKQSLFSNIFTRNFTTEKNYRMIFSGNKKSYKFQKAYQIMKHFIENDNDCHKVKGFNSGFYIVSNIHFKSDYMIHLLKKLINTQEKYKCFNFGTQVVMNLMHIDNRIYIDKLWNTLPRGDLTKIKIIHWNGRIKPWKQPTNSPTDKLWFDYYYKIYPEKAELFNKIINKKSSKKSSKKISKKSSKKISKKISKNNKLLLRFISRQ